MSVIAYHLSPIEEDIDGGFATACMMECMVTGDILSGSGGGGTVISPEVYELLRNEDVRSYIRSKIALQRAESNIFGIIWYYDSDGNRVYRCRGMGRTYRLFYKQWVPLSSYRSIKEDWPWDYFVFDNMEDHNRLIAEFGDMVTYEPISPADPN